jgi:hypothetical protein
MFMFQYKYQHGKKKADHKPDALSITIPHLQTNLEIASVSPVLLLGAREDYPYQSTPCLCFLDPT